MTPVQQANHARILAHLHEIDRALAIHAAWLARFNRQMICDDAAVSEDLAEDAHLRCRFGVWIYSGDHSDLADGDTLAAIEATHRSMHDTARHLLVCRAEGSPIPGADYDAFAAIANRFRQLLRQLEHDQMEGLGAVDKLTGVWNRQAVNLRLAEEVERIQRTRLPCTLCYADLDNFARFNDTHGHRLGDAMLKAVAVFFAQHLRRYDTIFRIAGEEFLFCLPNTSIPQAALLIDRLRISLAGHSFALEGHALRLTASFGVVALEPIFFIEETLERVERAQIIAKASGGNQVCVWKDEWEGAPA